MSRSVTSVLSVVGIGIVVAGAIWYGMSQGSGSSSGSLIANQPVATSADERELVETLLALRSVTLDGSIFTQPAFMSLKDFGTQIVPEPAGRPNPFAPLGGGGGAPIQQVASPTVPAAATAPVSATPTMRLPRSQQQ